MSRRTSFGDLAMRCEKEDKACLECNARVLQELVLKHWEVAESSIDAER